jgi:hypothetical protein
MLFSSDFIYHGEVNVAQEELNSFLSAAEDLQIKGLSKGQQEGGAYKTVAPPRPRAVPIPFTRKTPAPAAPGQHLAAKRPRPAHEVDPAVKELAGLKTEPIGAEMTADAEDGQSTSAAAMDPGAFQQGVVTQAESIGDEDEENYEGFPEGYVEGEEEGLDSSLEGQDSNRGKTGSS